MNILLSYNKTYVYPIWLTMVRQSGECQLCHSPEGNTRSYYLNIKYNGDDKFGFLVCSKKECNVCIQNYLYNLYSNIYNTKQWKRILNIYANNLFITVERSNGTIENDWVLDNDSDHNSNKNPLTISFLYAIMCNNKQYQNGICAKLPLELWQYIYTMCLETYSDYINLILSSYNKDKHVLEPYIRVKKDNVYKNVLMNTIFFLKR
jgi:hypothetical protein